MPCPCCLSYPVPTPPAGGPSDWWCEWCQWLFPVELIEGRDPLEIRGLTCPKHGHVATYPDAPYRMRMMRTIYERLSPADRDELDRRVEKRQKKGKEGQ